MSGKLLVAGATGSGTHVWQLDGASQPVRTTSIRVHSTVTGRMASIAPGLLAVMGHSTPLSLVRISDEGRTYTQEHAIEIGRVGYLLALPGSRFITTCRGEPMKVCSVSGELLAVLGEEAGYQGMQLSPSGHLVLINMQWEVEVWDVDAQELVRTLPPVVGGAEARAVCPISPTRLVINTRGHGTWVQSMDGESAAVLTGLGGEELPGWRSLFPLHEGGFLVSGQNYKDPAPLLFSAKAEATCYLRGLGGQLVSVASCGGGLFITGDEDRALRVWRGETQVAHLEGADTVPGAGWVKSLSVVSPGLLPPALHFITHVRPRMHLLLFRRGKRAAK